MWWIKKKKKCKCPCHYRTIGFKNPPDVHCPECEKFNKEARIKRLASPQHQRSILIKKIDDCVSLIIRIKAEWTCVKCQRKYPPVLSRRTGLPAQNLMTTSHYFNRGDMSIRWDYEDLDAICIFCHQKIENHKKDDVEGFNYEQYMINKLGAQRFELLRQKSMMFARYTIQDLQFILEEKQKELKTVIELYGNNY